MPVCLFLDMAIDHCAGFVHVLLVAQVAFIGAVVIYGLCFISNCCVYILSFFLPLLGQ